MWIGLWQQSRCVPMYATGQVAEESVGMLTDEFRPRNTQPLSVAPWTPRKPGALASGCSSSRPASEGRTCVGGGLVRQEDRGRVRRCAWRAAARISACHACQPACAQPTHAYAALMYAACAPALGFFCLAGLLQLPARQALWMHEARASAGAHQRPVRAVIQANPTDFVIRLLRVKAGRVVEMGSGMAGEHASLLSQQQEGGPFEQQPMAGYIRLHAPESRQAHPFHRSSYCRWA